jgi:hypothetical protein
VFGFVAVAWYDPTTWARLGGVDYPVTDGFVRSVQADADPERELAVADGRSVQLIDLDGARVGGWSAAYLDGLCELDGDPEPELLARFPESRGVDLATGQPITPPLPERTFCATDLDGDGASEVSVGDGRTVRLLDAATATERWSAPDRDPWINLTALRGPGGRRELLAGLGQETLVVDANSGRAVDGVPRRPDTTSASTGLPWDLNGDGVDELINFGVDRIDHYDRTTGQWTTQTVHEEYDAVGADLDGDGHQELVVRAPGALIVRDGETGARLYTVPLPAPTRDRVTAGDLDGDGVDEIGLLSATFGAQVGRVTPAGFTPLWVVPGVTAGPWLRDDDGDGLPSAWAVTGAQLCRYEPPATGAIWCQQVTTSAITALEVVDVDRDGVPEVATFDPRLFVRRASDGEVLFSYADIEMGITAVGPRLIVASQAAGTLSVQEVVTRRGVPRRVTLAEVPASDVQSVTFAADQLYLATARRVERVHLAAGVREVTPYSGFLYRALRVIPTDDSVWVRQDQGWLRFGP